jgi:ABC-type uncharacterized transport system permease subunit
MEVEAIVSVIVSLLSGLLGAVIGGLFLYYATIRQINRQARIGYVLQLIGSGNNQSSFQAIVHSIKNKNASTLQASQKSPFYDALTLPISKKLNDELENAISRQKWDRVNQLMRKILLGDWD